MLPQVILEVACLSKHLLAVIQQTFVELVSILLACLLDLIDSKAAFREVLKCIEAHAGDVFNSKLITGGSDYLFQFCLLHGSGGNLVRYLLTLSFHSLALLFVRVSEIFPSLDTHMERGRMAKVSVLV